MTIHKNEKSIKIKLYKTLHISYFVIWVILNTIVTSISLFFSKTTSDMLNSVYIFVGVITLGLIVLIIIRLTYKSFLVVNDDSIQLYKKNKLVASIERENIIGLGHRNNKRILYLFSIFNTLAGDPMCDFLSIRFKYPKIDNKSVNKFDSVHILKTLSDDEIDLGINELVLGLTKKEIKLLESVLSWSAKPAQLI